MIRRLLPILLAAALPACLPESKHPLSSPSASRIDRRLEGLYAPHGTDKDNTGRKGKKEDPEYWHFHYRGLPPTTPNSESKIQNSRLPRTTPWLEIMSVEVRADSGFHTQRYEALTTTIAGRDYMSFIELDQSKAKKSGMRPYSFARYEINWRGDLRIWLADNKTFAAAIKDGKIRGSVTRGKYTDTVKITDSTDRLAAFVAASDPKTLFTGDPLVLKRIAR